MGLDDFAPATKANDLDEDLFDFPPMELPKGPEAQATDEPALAASVDVAAAPAPTSAGSSPVVCTGLNPELDEDLFGFPPMDLSSLGIVSGKSGAAGLEDSIDMASQQVSDLLEDDLGDIVEEARAVEATTAAPQAQAAQAPAVAPQAPASAAPAPTANPIPQPAPAQFAAPAAMPMAYAPVAVSSASPKALWVLTAAVILFMVGLLSIAWRATSVFQQQIQAVRNDVQASTQQLHESTTGSIQELAAYERELLRHQVAVAKEGRDSKVEHKGLVIARPHEVVLSVAADTIAAGQFPEARTMLYNLLAEADSHPAAVRSEMERRANFLIAQSHKEQAESMTGGNP